jgi:hypothetical protein
MRRTLACPSVEIVPVGTAKRNPPVAEGGIFYANYSKVVALRSTYNDVVATHDTYSDLMWGHRGYPGGVAAAGLGGYGIQMGYEDDFGVEWWTTNVDGWDDGAVVEADEQPGLTSGTFVDLVKERGRRVVVQGTIVGGDDQAAFDEAKRRLAGALSSRPHMGRLYIGDTSLPVALAGNVKSKQISQRRADFELELVGRNVGTPGRGVWREGASKTYPSITADGSYDIGNDPEFRYTSGISSGMILTLIGPFNAGLTIAAMYGIAGIGTIAFKAIPAGGVVVYDASSRRITLDGTPALWLLDSIEWLDISPVLQTIEVSGVAGTTAASKISLQITELT